MTKEEFSALFPKKEIKYKDKVIATVKPIPAQDMVNVIHNIKNIIEAVGKGASPESLMLTALEDLTKLIPYSVETELEEIPGIFLPDIFRAIIELNLNEVVVKNWSALLEDVGKTLENLGGEKQDQSGK